MRKIYNLSIVLSFAGLWLTTMFYDTFETVFGFVLIFTFGILHGSNDILLINSFSNSNLNYPFFRVLGIYLLTVFSAVILFYILPAVVLSLFILFSAFHFGEQHWNYRELPISKNLCNFFYFIYGLFVLQILFILNVAEVIEIVQSITAHTIAEDFILYSFFCNLIVFAVFILYLFFRSKIISSIILLELFYVMFFGIIFKVSSLIWGFTIYFIIWHSIPSLFEQVTFIYGDFNKKSFSSYCKKAFPYWLISLMGIAIVYYIFKDEKVFYAIFFSFIAAVTFPHALVINKMFGNKKNATN